MGLSQPLWLSLRPNPLPMLHLRHGTDITMVVGQDIMVVGEDTKDMADTTDMVLDTTDTVTWENALLMLNPKLMPKLPLRLMLMLLPGIMVATTDTPTDTDTMVWDTVDTTDILTTTDTVTSENALLMLNPKLMPNPRLRPLPGTDTMVDIMDIPTDTDTTDIPTDVTIGRFLSLSQILAVLSKLANFYPPFELSTNQQLLPSKILKYLFFSKNILLQTSSFG